MSIIPRWKQVYGLIKGRIDDGTYAPGSRLPSVVELLSEFGVATGMGQKVHRALWADGLIVTVPGLGIFVKTEEQHAATS